MRVMLIQALLFVAITLPVQARTQIDNQLRGAATDAILGNGVGEASLCPYPRGVSQRRRNCHPD